jgi:hypothetical protein
MSAAMGSAARWADTIDSTQDAELEATNDYEGTEKTNLCLRIIREERCAVAYNNSADYPALLPVYLE